DNRELCDIGKPLLGRSDGRIPFAAQYRIELFHLVVRRRYHQRDGAELQPNDRDDLAIQRASEPALGDGRLDDPFHPRFGAAFEGVDPAGGADRLSRRLRDVHRGLGRGGTAYFAGTPAPSRRPLTASAPPITSQAPTAPPRCDPPRSRA